MCVCVCVCVCVRVCVCVLVCVCLILHKDNTHHIIRIHTRIHVHVCVYTDTLVTHTCTYVYCRNQDQPLRSILLCARRGDPPPSTRRRERAPRQSTGSCGPRRAWLGDTGSGSTTCGRLRSPRTRNRAPFGRSRFPGAASTNTRSSVSGTSFRTSCT